jgi:hypothetical protein
MTLEEAYVEFTEEFLAQQEEEDQVPLRDQDREKGGAGETGTEEEKTSREEKGRLGSGNHKFRSIPNIYHIQCLCNIQGVSLPDPFHPDSVTFAKRSLQ